MEMISENRPTRGRPPEFSATELAFLASWFPDVKTRRGLHNIGYRQRALRLLMHDSQFAWLCGKERMQRSKGKGWKPAILVELGRLKDPELIREVAAILCERKPKTCDAIDMVRRVRNLPPKPDPRKSFTDIAFIESLFGDCETDDDFQVVAEVASRIRDRANDLVARAEQRQRELARSRFTTLPDSVVVSPRRSTPTTACAEQANAE